jgi:selenium metabolism protein YedF
MTTTVDARGQACPQPVMQTRRAMLQADHVVTLVDNEGSATNVLRMAESAGWRALMAPQGNDYRIELSRPGAASEVAAIPLGKAETLSGPVVLALSGDQMGHSDPELGRLLMASFVRTLFAVQPKPDQILLFEAGVKLACQDSPVLDELRALEAQGIEILACRTCLDFYKLTEKLAVGSISNMFVIAETMFAAGRLVNL